MTRKAPLIERSYRHTIGAGTTVNLTRAFGVNFRIMRGSDDRRYLCALGWYPVSRTQLRHFSGSLKLPGSGA